MVSAKSMKRKRKEKTSIPGDKIQKLQTSVDATTTIENGNGPKLLSTLISTEEIEITVDTLLILAKNPSLIKSKPCKSLRTAVFDFRQACTTGMVAAVDNNLTARVSAAITDGKHVDALVLLAEMRIRNETPKLGALCRWVRDLDVVSGVCVQTNERTGAAVAEENLARLKVLDFVSRVTGPLDLNLDAYQNDTATTGPGIRQQHVWNLRNQDTTPLPIRASVLDGSIFESESQQDAYRAQFHIIESTPGPQRKPPNFHSAIVYLTDDDTVPLSKTSPQISSHKHPHVPNLSMIKNFLSRSECKAIIAATESIGFLPDAPIRDDGQETSILAHNVYWVIDRAFHNKLWARVAPFIPSHVAGKKARSINRRFRVYRYVPGAEYRVHIDGAWPPSGVNPVTKTYVYDDSPIDAKQSSLFTFLIYLNDEFEGGETTFFLPSVNEGVMNAYPVNPVMGSGLLFPHGDAVGALLHEGTGVRKGAKYVIRTDVEFDVMPGLE